MNMEAGIGGMTAARPDSGEKSRRRTVLIAIGIIVVVLAGAWFLLHRGGAPKKAADAAPQVTVVTPGRHEVTAEINAVGNITARRDMPVGIPGEGGLIRAVLVEAGDWVKAGQPLAIVDRSVQMQQAAATAATILQNKADAALALANINRARALVKNGFISRADIDTRQAALDSANARVVASQAQLRQQQALIGRLDVRAPAAGLVLTRSAEAGQIVGPGTGALFRVAQDGAMELQARLAEADLARLHVGSTAFVTPVGTTLRIPGRIWQISPIIDPTSRQGTVRIALPYNPALRPGGFGAAEIEGGRGDLPLLPESAVMSDATGNFVYLIDGENRVVRRNVKIGDVDDRGVTIRSGLSGTERVVASAGAFLNSGEKVQPRTAAAPH